MAAVHILTVMLCYWYWSCWWCVTSITCEPPPTPPTPPTPPVAKTIFISTMMKCFGKCCTALSDFGYRWKYDVESDATASSIAPISTIPPTSVAVAGNGLRRACWKRELECICQECLTPGGGGGAIFHQLYNLNNSSPSRISQLSCISSTILMAALLDRERAQQFSVNDELKRQERQQRQQRPGEQDMTGHDGTNGKTERMGGEALRGRTVSLLDQLAVISVQLAEKVKESDSSLVSLDERDRERGVKVEEVKVDTDADGDKSDNETAESGGELESGATRRMCNVEEGERLNKLRGCESVFSSLNFWGAHIVVFANITYIISYMFVVVVYLVLPGLHRRAYEKAVLWFNLLQVILNLILIGTGVTLLCHTTIHPRLFAPLGLIIMFLTISSTFWLFVICIDMTLVITRFRWTPRADAAQRHQQREQETRKYRIYATCSWTGGLLPTVLAAILELSPLLDKSSPFRPNFHQFQTARNLAAMLYIATLPLLTCLANALLFFYTTYRIVVMERSIRSVQLTITTCGRSRNLASKQARKRYWLLLKLCLIMDAPWITSTLAVLFIDLWFLKFLRVMQPIVTMFVILPRHTFLRIGQTIRSILLPHSAATPPIRPTPTPPTPTPAPAPAPAPALAHSAPSLRASGHPRPAILDTSTDSTLSPTSPIPHPHHCIPSSLLAV